MYFQRHHQFMPIMHPGRYIQSFYSAPHKRPPMCLQYAVWTMASNGHEKYASYHDIFYKRARQYADADEMRVRPIPPQPARRHVSSSLTSRRATGSTSFPSHTPKRGL